MYNIYVNGVFTESFITEEEAIAYCDAMVEIKYEKHVYEKLVKAAWPFPTNYQLDLFTGEYPVASPNISAENPVVYHFPTMPKP